jgi:hypothetical protein
MKTKDVQPNQFSLKTLKISIWFRIGSNRSYFEPYCGLPANIPLSGLSGLVCRLPSSRRVYDCREHPLT